MVDVLANYMKKIEAQKAELDRLIAEKDSEIAEKNTIFVTYLIKDNKSNEEIKEIVSDITDEFINNIRESLSNK